MGKFITVLNSDLGSSYWPAVANASSEDQLRAKTTYLAGNSSPFNKSAGDQTIGPIRMMEEITGNTANATMILLAGKNAPSIVTNIKHQFNLLTKRVGVSIIVFAMLISAMSCTTNGHLTRRYRSLEIQTINNIENYIQAQAYVIEQDKDAPKPKKSIFELSPQAQKELIRQFGKKETESAKLIDDITKPLTKSSSPAAAFLDYTNFQNSSY